MAKTYREVLKWASSFLESQDKEGHAIFYLFLHRKNWQMTDWLLHMNEVITSQAENQIKTDIDLLLTDMPPQYLLGYEEFFGRRFKVTHDTLIPRPETEELVDLCLKQNISRNENKRVVDVGTGTGAIAVTLKLERPIWQVLATDISEKALIQAQANAQNLRADVAFFQGDTLEPIKDPIDILISNPPYISEEEWPLMDASVRKYEPKEALFAKNNGYAIYQKLARQAQKKLAINGQIFLEIGFQQGPKVQEIFQQAFPRKEVQVLKDLAGQNRMVFVH